ncbi:MAG: FliH/SctL family protein [Proteobacteria bacterium]|nr:FliH/SctL family protein [Pseudomonadota bacterium]
MTNSPKIARPFSFDVSFDSPRIAQHQETVKENAPPPIFSMEDLEEAREEGFEEGRKAALEAAAGGIEERIADAFEAVKKQLSAIDHNQEEANTRTQAMSLALLRRIVEKLFPAMIANYGMAEIENILDACMPLITDGAKVFLRINDDVAPEVERRLQNIIQQNGILARVTVLPDPELGPSDCILNWGDGGAERDFDALWSQIDVILSKAQEATDTRAMDDPGISGADAAEPDIEQVAEPVTET